MRERGGGIEQQSWRKFYALCAAKLNIKQSATAYIGPRRPTMSTGKTSVGEEGSFLPRCRVERLAANAQVTARCLAMVGRNETASVICV